MMSWKIYDEAVDMVQQRFRYLPHAFCWRGRRYTVEAVEKIWTVSRRGRRRGVDRRFFQVRCSAGSFELYQDLRAGTWHLRRAKLAAAPLPKVARRAVPAWR
jgi:hypothetical protein